MFRVTGSNSDGIRSEEIATSIVIVPSWWQTWWFKTIAAITVGLFFYAAMTFYKIRMQFNNIAFMGKYIAHEINNPLASLRISCDLLSKVAPAKDARISAIAQRIDTNIIQINEGVNTFRDLDPIYVRCPKKENSFEPVDILSLTNEYAESVRKSITMQEIDLNIHSGGSARALIDPMDFRVILKNLLANAIHAVTLKGKDADYRRKIEIDLKCHAEKNVLIFEVKDNGIGMDKNTLRMCRRPYFSTKYKTDRENRYSEPIHRVSGIGLAIVQNKIDKYKMKLEIESRENEGSCFRIYIPIGHGDG